MVEWIVSSSVLIAVVTLLRFVLKGKISLRLQYALWAMVLVRLLVPVSFGDTTMSVGNLTQRAENTELARLVSALSETELPKMSYQAAYDEVAREYADKGVRIEEMPLEQYAETVDYEIMHKMSGGVSVAEIAQSIWLCGAGLVGLWFAISNLRLQHSLKRTRTLLTDRFVLPVYLSDAIDTPCLFGLFRPAVYLTGEAAENEHMMHHAVEHELTHFRHKDNIWAILRGVCLAVHWYNPLVWCAAVLSGNDAELACDESTILRLGEEDRAAYGRTLIHLTCEKRPALLNTATTMTGSGRSIKERISLIVKKPKMALYTVIAVVIIAAVAVGCTFTGARNQPVSSEMEQGKSEHKLHGFAVQADGSRTEIGRQWAEAFVSQYVNDLSEEHPLKSRDCAVLSCDLFAESLTSTPKKLIFDMRFACLAKDDDSFENWYAGWAGPLADVQYPQYAGWMEFGYIVVLEQTAGGLWSCADAGTGGYGGWGWLNFGEEGEIDFRMEQLLRGEDGFTAELLLRILPFINWPDFERTWGEEGWNALQQMLDQTCLSQGQVYGPEETTMWSDVYPEDQVYRNLYVMLAAQNADGAYKEGLTEILRKQQEHGPALFETCLQQLALLTSSS